MIYLVLLTITIVLFAVCLALLAIVIEAHRTPGHRPIRRWRVALSRRKQIHDALKREGDAHAVAQRSRDYAQKTYQDAKRTHEDAGRRISEMGAYIVAEQCGDHIKAIRANNYHAKEKKILRAIDKAAMNGYKLPESEQSQITRMLKEAHDRAILAEEEKQRQASIREEIREEQKAQREYDRALKKADELRKQKEREAEIRQKALEEAIELLGDAHSAKLDEMRAKVAQAQAEAQAAREAAERTKSMAEQTKRGNIYIISNIGSFGENVFKVGMTRRLEPLDRVKELGDASVPFTFDVHAMIESDNAPALEAALHRRLHNHRVNRVNTRKEFFRVPLVDIIDAVRAEHGDVTYEADAEALEYLESQAMSEDHESVEERIKHEADDVDALDLGVAAPEEDE